MAQPVWTLSVDLQTKTATFTSGLADAAKSARGSFSEIKAGASEMGAETGYSMTEARHSVMLLGEEFGVHIPRALTSFLASLGPIGGAMEAAFPFLAIAVGATLLLEHLAKIREEGTKLTESQVNFGTTAAHVLNSLNDKLLEAGIRADQLRGDHLAALNKQLELIDHQSMNDLVRAFGELAKASDTTFEGLKTHWYQVDAGSAKAKQTLDEIHTKYSSLMEQHNDQGASNFLSNQLTMQQRILDLQKQAKDAQAAPDMGHQGDAAKYERAKLSLKQLGYTFDQKEIEAQQTLVDVLQKQVEAQAAVSATKKQDQSNARLTEQNRADTDGDKAAREQAQSQRAEAEEMQRLWEENYRQAVSALQESEREKIDATNTGSQARLAAINAAIREEESKGLQETGFYKALLTERTNLIREMGKEEDKIKQELGKEGASHTTAMARLDLAAKEESDRQKLALHKSTAQQMAAEDIQAVKESTQVEIDGYNRDIAALDTSAADYLVKYKALKDKIVELERQSANQIQKIQDEAAKRQAQSINQAYGKMSDDISRDLAQVLTRHETFAKMVTSLGDQAAQGLLQNAMKSILADDMTKEHDAAAAARKAFLAGENSIPGIPGVILGGVMAAGAFASVMAFESGGIVPGVGNGDIVPAMLTPGEAVLPKGLTETLTNAAKHGNASSGQEVHVHHHITNHISALDGVSVRRVLNEHADIIHDHVEHAVRKMNK